MRSFRSNEIFKEGNGLNPHTSIRPLQKSNQLGRCSGAPHLSIPSRELPNICTCMLLVGNPRLQCRVQALPASATFPQSDVQ